MHSNTFHFLVLIGTIMVIYHQTSAEQITRESTWLDSSEEFENGLVQDLQQRYRTGFETMILFFSSINATIEKIDTRLKNLETKITGINSNVKKIKQENSRANARLEHLEMDVYSLKEVKENRIRKLLLHPRAKVYSGVNYTGESEDIENVTTECVERKCGALRNLSGRVKSIQTFGTCVRLFQSKNFVLGGWSLAVYPGSTIPADMLTSKLEGVKGIAPCLPDEFDGATIDQSTQLVKKNHSDIRTTVPDQVEFFSYKKWNKGISMNTSYSYDKYLLGPFNRVEYLLKVVYENDPNPTPKPTSAMESTAFYRSLNKLPGDVVGFGIPIALGGQANKAYNIFPQTPRGAEEWLRITADIPTFVTNKSNLGVVVALNFMYENNNSSRPFAFYYFINYGNLRISYGRVRN